MADDEEHALQQHSPNAGVVAAAGLSAVPYVGGPVATLLMERWARMSQRNVAEYVQGIEQDLEELAYDVAMLEAPMDDPQVQEVFARAGRTAQFSSHAATRRRCRNAAVNAIVQPERAAMNLRFVQLLDRLTPAHFTLLKLLEDPTASEDYMSAVGGIMGGGMLAPLTQALGYSEDLVSMLAGDLQQEGLAQMPGNAMMTAEGLKTSRIEDRGRQLLEFVERPVAGVA